MLQPSGYRVLIKPDAIEETTAGGIIIPETTRQKDQFRQSISTVIAIGEFAFQDSPGPWYKCGDRVVTKEFPGVIVREPSTGEEYRLINDVDVLATIV
jgi:chaperonin GroES